MRTAFGEYLYSLRAAKYVSLRKFALQIGMDPAFYSRIERGEVAPPSEKILAKIAEGLGVGVGWSGEWFDLIDRAAADKGQVPDDLVKNEQIARMLPALYAKLREEQPRDHKEMYQLYLKVLGSDSEPDRHRENGGENVNEASTPQQAKR